MTKHIREIAPSGIENVSRRGVLKGMLSTDRPRARRDRFAATVAARPPMRPNGARTACRTAR